MELEATREAYADKLVQLGRADERIVVLDADLSSSTYTAKFKKCIPERFFNIGVAEANMIGIGAGLATCGKVVFVNSFAVFSTSRVLNQIRTCICAPDLPVKIVGTHAGIITGEDGGSHQAIEDIAIMQALPNITVIVPADANETKAVLHKIVDYPHPVYLRLSRPKIPYLFPQDCQFEIGKVVPIIDKGDVAIFACGILVHKAKAVAEKLGNVKVINVSTIKPLDVEGILAHVQGTRGVVVCEEHTLYGGLGWAIAQVLCERYPIRMRFVAIKDKFGVSGKPEELLKFFHLSEEDIIAAVESFD